MKTVACFVAVLALALRSAAAAEYYVDPAAGSMAGDGSAAQPWRTMQEVWEAGLVETQHWTALPYEEGVSTLGPKNAGAPVRAGDTIWLRSGYHGELFIEGAYNAAPITIAAEAGHTPKLRFVHLRAAGNWVIRGLSVSPSHAPVYEPRTMIDVENHGWQGPSWDVVVEDNELFSQADSSAWSLEDWNTLPPNGIQVDGDRCTVRGNRLRNVDFGISVSGEDALVERNVVENFAGDGLRGLGDRGVFQYNVVKNCYDVNENHDDGFQSWSATEAGVGTGEVVGIVLRGNVIINYEDPNQAFRGTLQGIGCFDGFFVDWVVENNVIVTDHWHGITLLGARDSRIVNNTVIDLNDTDPGPPWIRVAPHKDGRPSEGVVVRNNLTTALSLEGSGITEDHNLIIDDANVGQLFVDAPGDLHLLATAAAAIDTGSADLAPANDAEGVPRPQGAGVDLGAYEWHAAPIFDAGPVGADAGPGGGGGDDEGGCGCSAGGRRGGSAAVGMLLLLVVAIRPRR